MPESNPPELHPDKSLRPICAADRAWIVAELHRNWASTEISSLERWHHADQLPGFVAWIASQRVGLVTHTPPDSDRGCEVITLSSCREGGGVGSMLLDACIAVARAAHCPRIFLTTTNDNLRAIGFYQKRGWSMVAVHRGAMDRARAIKPSIPLVGMNGIPLRDEIEFELALPTAPLKA